jgi:K319L-like, PKD domain
MNKIISMAARIVVPVMLLYLTACGGGGGGGSGTAGTPGLVANAGTEVDVSAGSMVTLDGSGSSDADGKSLTYTWRQTSGPDVTGGKGTLSGPNPSFPAPDAVESLVFQLTVNNGASTSAPSMVVVNALEDATKAYFVDGDNGSDTNSDGSRNKPFSTLAHALSQVTTNAPQDIYVMTRANKAPYDETATDLQVPAGTSLYGGYNANWVRDVKGDKSLVNANSNGVRFTDVTQDAWFSGFNLLTADSANAADDVVGVRAQGDTTSSMHILDNVITNGNVATGFNSNPGNNYGLLLLDFKLAQVSDNVLTAGKAGAGSSGSTGADGAPGDKGDNGDRTGGRQAPGGSGGPGGNGGHGGTRGGGLGGSGGDGSQGGTGTAPVAGITNIAGGAGGSGGNGGKGGSPGSSGGPGLPGNAGNGFGSLTSTLFAPVNGSTGGPGGVGSGGGGGGGGDANSVGVVGGGGGGGGEGGAGGAGGRGGASGGASIGVWLHNIGTTSLTDNIVTANVGGSGGSAGLGGVGGIGGTGGSGATGDDLGILGNGAGGGGGANGGFGGTGGRGGAGGGGPSFGVVFSAGMAPTFTGNTITSGKAGNGGGGGSNGNGGEGGYSFAVFDRNPNDAFFATLNQNTLAFGTAGSGGGSSGLDTSKPGADGQAGEHN